MRTGNSWSERGPRPEPRDSNARWADAPPAYPEGRNDPGERRRYLQPQQQPQAGGYRDAPDNREQALSALNNRLDEIGRRLDALADAATAPRTTQPPRRSGPPTGPSLTEQFSDDRFLDQALSEIAARQRDLDQGSRAPAAPRPAAPQPPRPAQSPVKTFWPSRPAPTAEAPPVRPPVLPADDIARPATQDMSRLEHELRQINGRIDSLQQSPAVERAIAELRAELGDIAGMLRNAVPRQAIEALEHQLRDLGERVDETRRIPAAEPAAIASLESNLTEVRDALRAMAPAESLSGLHRLVDGISHRLDRIAAGSQEPEMLRQLEDAITTLRGVVSHVASNETLDRLAEDIQTLSKRIDQIAETAATADMVAQLDRRIAELADAFAARHAEPAPQVVISSPLEDDLRNIVSRLEQLATTRPDAEAFGALEQRVTSLTDAVFEVRSFAAMPQPAPVSNDLHSIVERLERLASARNEHPVLEALEHRIAALTETVEEQLRRDTQPSAIEYELRSVIERLDRLAAVQHEPSALSALEHRVGLLADAFATFRATEPPTAKFEGVLEKLVDRLEGLSLSRADQTALGALEDRIAKLVAKLDASDARLNHLETIEHALAELLIHLEQQRAQQRSPAFAAAADVRDLMPQELGRLQHDLDEIRRAELNTQDQLEAAHGTLGHVVERLAQIERGMRDDHDPEPPPRGSRSYPQPPAPPAAEPRTQDTPPSPPSGSSQNYERRPLDPSLPPDHPLEPGLGAALQASLPANATPAERIAASEAALRNVKPPVIPDPGNRGDFIAAARRAAQAASATAAADQASNKTSRKSAAPSGLDEDKPGLAKRVRSLFVGTGVVLFVLGALHVTARMIGPMDEDGKVIAALPDSSITAPIADPKGIVPPVQQAGVDPNPTGSINTTKPDSPSAAPYFSPSWLNTAPGATSPSIDTTGSIGSAATAPAVTVPSAPALSAPPVVGISAGLRAAADAGNAGAAYEVGTRYADGNGVSQNPEEAARWFDRAAKAGVAPAQFRLGGMYEKGIGVKKNLDTARDLYRSAADAGNAMAMHNLAVLYAEGGDGKPDYRSAIQWFRKAADRAIHDSQFNLGVLYARGIGVERNFGEAYKWFALAAREGDKDAATKRDEIATHLDKQALTAARLAVDTWTPLTQPESAVTVAAPPGGWDALQAPTKRTSKSAPQYRPSRQAAASGL